MPVLERKWWTLIIVCTAIFMLLLDISIVNVALPSIQRSLHASFSDLQWVVDAYALTLASFMLTAGVLGDMYGRREMFAIGLVVFSVSSLVCGLSTDSLMLNLARAVQGVGGAIMFATSLALIADAFSGKERGTAFGIYGSVIGGAVAIGPLLGGVITSGIGWRWIFFVNVPIGAIAIVLTLSKILHSSAAQHRRLDFGGFITFSAALFLLVFALVRGNTDGWGSTMIVSLFAASAALLVAFVIVEHSIKEPMLDLSLFRRPAMIGISITAFCLAASIFSMFLYLTLYVQDNLGYSPLQAGLRFLPITMLAFIAAPFAGKLSVRMPTRLLLGVGMAVVGVGLLLMGFTKTNSSWTVLLPGFLVGGLGIGLTNPVLASSAVAVVPPARSGMASGANNTFRQVGIATGIATLGTIFESQMNKKVSASLLSTPAGRAAIKQHGKALETALASGSVRTAIVSWPKDQAHALLAAYHPAFSSSLNLLMIVGMSVAFVGSIAAFGLVRQRDFVPSFAAGAPGGPGGGPGGHGGPGGGSGGPGGAGPSPSGPGGASEPAAAPGDAGTHEPGSADVPAVA